VRKLWRDRPAAGRELLSKRRGWWGGERPSGSGRAWLALLLQLKCVGRGRTQWQGWLRPPHVLRLLRQGVELGQPRLLHRDGGLRLRALPLGYTGGLGESHALSLDLSLLRLCLLRRYLLAQHQRLHLRLLLGRLGAVCAARAAMWLLGPRGEGRGGVARLAVDGEVGEGAQELLVLLGLLLLLGPLLGRSGARAGWKHAGKHRAGQRAR